MTLESSKMLGGIGAILMVIGPWRVPYTGIIGLVGLILVLVAFNDLANYYKDRHIFNNVIFGVIAAIIGVVVAVTVIVTAAFGMLKVLGIQITNWTDWTALQNFNWQDFTDWSALAPYVAAIVGALVILVVFLVVAAIFLRRSLNTLSEKSGIHMFATTGLLRTDWRCSDNNWHRSYSDVGIPDTAGRSVLRNENRANSATDNYDPLLASGRFRKTQKLRDSLRNEENCLKILVVYDSVSVNRNTEKVAKAMSEVLKEKGFDVDVLHVKDVDSAGVKSYDCVLAGSPTQAWRATGPIMQFLDRFARDEFSGKLAAAFDTQVQSRISGNAAKRIEKKLEKLGFKIVIPPLVSYVEGKMQEIHLKEGELEKAKKYAEDLAKALHP